MAHGEPWRPRPPNASHSPAPGAHDFSVRDLALEREVLPQPLLVHILWQLLHANSGTFRQGGCRLSGRGLPSLHGTVMVRHSVLERRSGVHLDMCNDQSNRCSVTELCFSSPHHACRALSRRRPSGPSGRKPYGLLHFINLCDRSGVVGRSQAHSPAPSELVVASCASSVSWRHRETLRNFAPTSREVGGQGRQGGSECSGGGGSGAGRRC